MASTHAHDEKSFGSWLFSRQEIVEKTAGLVVLSIELVNLTKEIFQDERIVEDKSLLSHFLNLFFLLFIYYYLGKDFKKKYHVSASNSELAKSLRLNQGIDNEKKICELVFNSNVFFRQLKNFNSFIITTACLYIVLLLKKAFIGYQDYHIIGLSGINGKIYFHLLIEFGSYLGAFYLLRCFYVMYLPTVDENGNDILAERTFIYKGLILVFMVFDFIVVKYNQENGFFISEFVCGIVNSAIFILLISRFGNKILDIPPVILCILYVYAILQTCLPFVTGDIFGERILGSNAESIKQLKEFLIEFSSIVLTLCLIGKVTLVAVFLYAISTGRIFYYFMTLKIIHEEEEKNWKEFAPKIESFSIEPMTFHLIFNQTTDWKYSATVPNLFDKIVGHGETVEDAKKDLFNKIVSSGKYITS